MEDAYAFIERDAPESAHKWASGIMDVISSLEEFPARCPIALENAHFEQEIRHIYYGKKRTYRIIFTIVGDVVSVLHIRHSAQDTLKPGVDADMNGDAEV